MALLVTRNLAGGINKLILRGLSANDGPPAPPAPPDTSFSPGSGASSGVPIILFDGVSSVVGNNSVVIALPPRPVLITWSTDYGTTPGTAQVVLDMSLDGIHWVILDFSSVTAGEIRNIKCGAMFLKARFGTMDAGVVTTVIISMKPITWRDGY